MEMTNRDPTGDCKQIRQPTSAFLGEWVFSQAGVFQAQVTYAIPGFPLKYIMLA